MKRKNRLRAWPSACILAACAFLAGGLNGLLGTGGGMVLVFALGGLLGKGRGKEVFVLSSFGILVFSLVSSLAYGAGGHAAPEALPSFALPAAAGGILGALLLDRLKLVWVKRLFALILLYSGLKMVGVV